MPELPEVETVKRGLERTIIGKTIQAVEIRVTKLFADDRQLIDQVLVGATVVAITRRAKVLLIEVSGGWTLAIHLKMTGQLVVRPPNSRIPILDPTKFVGFAGGHPEKAYQQPLPHKHSHVIIEFSEGTKLYFNDLRKFGWMKLLRGSSRLMNPALGITQKKVHPTLQILDSVFPTVDDFIMSLHLGPEPFSADFTVEYLMKLLKKRTIPIKQLLLEQKGISGIGNIYADEALFRSGIAPKRTALSLQLSEVQKLHRAIREVLELGIKHGGTSKNTYLNVEGTRGEMQDHLKVYQRSKKPCIVCATPIKRIKIGARSAHFCPRCQK